MSKLPRDMDENELRYYCAAIDDENKRLRAALEKYAMSNLNGALARETLAALNGGART